MTEAMQPALERPPLLHPPSIEELAAKYRGRDIVIVGNGPTGRRHYSDLGLPLWVVNGGWQWHSGAELCWMMDDLEGPAWDNVVVVNPNPDQVRYMNIDHLQTSYASGGVQRVERTRAQVEEVTKQCPVPIMTSVAYPEKFPQTVAYPLEEVLTGRRHYVAETVCFAAAWALHIGVRSILFGGCDYGGIRPAERAGLEYWIGRLEEAGIPVSVVEGSQLMNTGPLNDRNRHIPGIYGYQEWTLGTPNQYELGAMVTKVDGDDERLGHEALDKLLSDYPQAHSILEVGHGDGATARHLSAAGKRVMAFDPHGREGYNNQSNGGEAWLNREDYLSPETILSEQFDAVYSCHVLEHTDDPQAMLRKMYGDLKEGGVFVITVPPAQSAVVGGHFTLWNAGLLLYHLVRAGFDCRDARVKQYGYNLSLIVEKKSIPPGVVPTDPNYPVEALRDYLPESIEWEHGTFNGDIRDLNWSK